MKIYSQTDNGTLYQGDCLEVLRWLPSDSIDTMITDPPYGLSFMGKKWDYDVPGVDVWKECLRVLKPGATALIFAGSRTQHRMAVNVEDAGFILKDTIMWIYGSGFPKSTDISKQLDKQKGKEARRIYLEVSGAIKTSGADDFCLLPKEAAPSISTYTTSVGQFWNGWGTALKPAYEPILVAMKPNDGTYAQNALKHGVAGLNIDGGRVEYQDSKDYNRNSNFDRTQKTDTLFWEKGAELKKVTNKGRFPANIILDEEAGRLLDEQSGILKSGGGNKHPVDSYRYGGNSLNPSKTKGDGKQFKSSQGGASRFFYCAKASKSERNAGCEELEEVITDDGRNISADNAYQRGKTLRTNSHPTVKPLALMEYLVKLTATPTGGTVLDPFAGSGTTGIACMTNTRAYVLIEKEIEYCEIIIARLGHAWFKNLCSDYLT